MEAFAGDRENMDGPTSGDNSLKSAEERKNLLAAALARMARAGWRIESLGEFQAVVVKGRRVNHILHLLIAIFTIGLWVLVWLVLAVSGGEQRYLVQVDALGEISRIQMSG